MDLATMATWKRGLLGALCLGGAVAWAEPPPSNSAQGTQLHGSGRFEFINVPLRSVDVPEVLGGPTCGKPTATVAEGRLRVTQNCAVEGTPMPVRRILEGPSLEKAVFRAPFEGRTVKLVIEAVRCHEDITPPTSSCDSVNVNAGKARWEYRVQAFTDDKTATPLCPTGSGYALSVPHAWSTSGDLLENPNFFTFACAPKNESSSSKPFFVGGGVIAKCIDWGYPPWATEYPESVAREYHQLCTRMAVADYCGEGRSNTLDGTPLAFMGPENAAVLSQDGHLPATLVPDGYALEAVWTMDSCGLARPLCLGKKRWDTLVADATCVDQALKIPVPKLTCEELDFHGTAQRMLVSYSLFIDRALVLFKKDSTDYVTTTAVTGVPGESAGGALPGAFVLAMEGLGSAAPRDHAPVRVEGPILSPSLPNDVMARMKPFIKALYRCGTSTGRMLLTDRSDCELAAGYSRRPLAGDQAIEGYIYSSVDPDREGQRRPLKLWRHPTLGVYATATLNPGGFTFVRDLGFLPAVGQLPGRDL
ncbi:hypothetical protein D7X30_13165 [Corallococcus sp. AB011P]|nr:hypothetical protein D7X30_13165 [Corallococcus sp. AB011P]